ncbi:hypothetical protein H4219_001077 [Mycoemilia scoparia]|uniref:CHY-type domain-containing protein n=1 Tax=Mycoemilia scoparia TaxID=417184 RepID=A0A9W8A192_9FUNG|nr:hypothetical protein H4219_001077 [Mycoemilia scoparia]
MTGLESNIADSKISKENAMTTEIQNSAENKNDETPKSKDNQKRKPKTVCKYIKSGEKCPFGPRCRFYHPKIRNGGDTIRENPSKASSEKGNDDKPDAKPRKGNNRSGRGRGKKQNAKPKARDQDQKAGPSVALKTQAKDLTRNPRFTAKSISADKGEQAFAVEMRPSDPDFPFDIRVLYFALVVPCDYPPNSESGQLVEIHIANKAIPTGVKHNIEKAFARYVRKCTKDHVENGIEPPTLCEYIQWLDNNLEDLMREKPAATIKFVSFSSKPTSKKGANDSEKTADDNQIDGKPNDQSHDADMDRDDEQQSTNLGYKTQQRPSQNRPPVQKPQPKYLANESEAITPGLRIEKEIGQLERRYRTSFEFIQNNKDGKYVVKFSVIPTDPDFDIDVGFIPVRLEASVPEDVEHKDTEFPKICISITIDPGLVVGRKGEPSKWLPEKQIRTRINYVESEFMKHVNLYPDHTMLKHFNWLDRQLVEFLCKPQEIRTTRNNEPPSALAEHSTEEREEPSDSGDQTKADIRPVRRGTEIRFGSLTLEGISLVTCHSLNLTVRCARCKNTTDVRDIKPTLQGKKDQQRWLPCSTCSSLVGIRFRPDYLFSQSPTLGYIDCSNCIPFDLLTSKYFLTCENCPLEDTEQQKDQMNIALTPGSLSMANCHNCHHRVKLRIADVQFNKLAAGDKLGDATAIQAQLSKQPSKAKARRQDLAQLGVIPGQPLPDKGTCKHYGKSYRWLRFPCCGKVYPCDICHDDNEKDHSCEMAKSMLCGHCAKEQSVQKAEQLGGCIACGSKFNRKSGGSGAFWEGGQGVRDRQKMSRKDPKKYKGLAKTTSSHKQKSA